MASFDRMPMAFVFCTALLAFACSTQDHDQVGSSKASAKTDAGGSDELQRWVGEVSDGDARVGVVADASQARLFFCGGAESYASATRWFTLDVSDGAVSFADDSWRVSARIEASRVTGEIELDGAKHAFSAQAVTQDTLAGLYEGQAECGRLGLIVQQPKKSSPIHAQGACVGNGHDPQQVNPILPVALSDGEIAVEAPGQPDLRVGLHALESF